MTLVGNSVISFVKEMKPFRSKQTQERVEFFESRLRFHSRKEPKNDSKNQKTQSFHNF